MPTPIATEDDDIITWDGPGGLYINLLGGDDRFTATENSGSVSVVGAAGRDVIVSHSLLNSYFNVEFYRDGFTRDTVIAGSGNDFIDADGRDRLAGGDGADTFRLVNDLFDRDDNNIESLAPKLMVTITDFSLDDGDSIGFVGRGAHRDIDKFETRYIEATDTTIIRVDNRGEIDRIRLLDGDFTDDLHTIFG